MNSYVINATIKVRYWKIFVRTEKRRCTSVGMCKKEAMQNLMAYLERVTYKYQTIKSVEVTDIYKTR